MMFDEMRYVHLRVRATVFDCISFKKKEKSALSPPSLTTDTA